MFKRQDIMRRVVYSLAPLLIFATLLYGWRVIVAVAVTFTFGIATEYLFERSRKKQVSEAVLVTCMLYALSLPPNTPVWITIVGIVFAVGMAKGVYGGFGRNIFNPAISGRLLIYVSFPAVLTTSWMVPALVDALSGLSFGGIGNLLGTSGVTSVDALSAATPLAIIRSGQLPNLWHLFLGFRGGSFGESSTVLILAAAVYMIHTKTANWRLIVATFVSALGFATVFYALGWIPGLDPSAYRGVRHLAPIAAYMMSGSILYVAVYMSTDPVSGPVKPLAQWAYGFLIGGVTMLVRVFGGFPEGTSFGIMVANTFSALLDEIFPKPKKKAKKAKGVVKPKAAPTTAGTREAKA